MNLLVLWNGVLMLVMIFTILLLLSNDIYYEFIGGTGNINLLL